MHLLRRHPILIASILATLLCFPSFFHGFMTDDFYHIIMMEDALGVRKAPTGYGARYDPFGLFSLFNFFDGDPSRVEAMFREGYGGWWMLPELRLNFWRPLTSQLALLDYRLFGRNPQAYLLHSLAWYLALIGVVGLLYRRTLSVAAEGGTAGRVGKGAAGSAGPSGRPVAGGATTGSGGGMASMGVIGALALVLFAIDDGHWMPAAWIANRNAVVAATLAFAGLVAHLRWREEGWKPGLPLSVLGYALGLAGAEAALGVFAFLACYELLAGRGSLVRRVAALFPGALVGLAWAAAYKVYHFGARGSAYYIDPVSEPVEYLTQALVRFPTLVAAMFGGPPSHLGLISPGMIPLSVAWGVGVLILCGLFLRAAWPGLEPEVRRAIRWMGPASLLSLLPVLATFPMDRLLLVAGVGAFPIVAVVARWCWQGVRARHWPRVALGLAVVLFHGVVPVATWLAMPQLFKSQNTRLPVLYDVVVPDVSRADETDVLVICGSDLTIGMYLPMWTVFQDRPEPRAWQLVSPAQKSHRVTRRDEDTLEVEVLDGGLLEGMVGGLYRDPGRAMPPGYQVQSGIYRFEVLETGPMGPTRVAVTTPRPLEAVRVLAWSEGALRPVTLPPIGESLTIVWTPGPAGM